MEHFVSFEIFLRHGLWKVWIFLMESTPLLMLQWSGMGCFDSFLSFLGLIGCFDLSS